MKQPSTKKAKTSSGPAPAPSAARPQRLQPSQGFVVCPVCQQSTAAATIDMHVEQCLLRPRPAQRPDAPPHPAPPPPSAAAAAAPQHDTRQQQQQLVLSPPPESAVRSAPAAPATAPATASGAAQHERHQEPQQQRQEPQQEQLQPQAPQQQQEERHEQGRHERPHQPPPQAPLAASTPPASSYSPHAAASPSAPPRLPPAPNALHALMQASHQQAAQHLDNKRGFHGTLAPPPPPHLAAPPTPPEALAQIPSTPPADMRVVAHEQLPGQYLLVNFLHPHEEPLLVRLCDEGRPGGWSYNSFSGSSKGRSWGVRVDFKDNVVSPATVPMPGLLLALAERMRQAHPLLKNFHPNDSNALCYERDSKHFLREHADNRVTAAEIIATLSLLGRATMTFRPDRRGGGGKQQQQQQPPDEVRVELPRRGLQVLAGDARYNWTHRIDHADLLDPRRISITFRMSHNDVGKNKARK